MSLIYKNLFLTTTDTVVGIGAPISSVNKKAIYNLKKRNKNKPLIIMVDSLKTAKKLKGWNHKANEIALKVWPGATTLVISNDLAVRVPNNNKLRDLLKKKGPSYMTSANISGEKILSLEQSKKVFSEIKEFYDFGEGSGIPSKIIDIRTNERLR